jgi:hypothetical protein
MKRGARRLDALRNAPAAETGLAPVGSSACAAIAFHGFQAARRLGGAQDFARNSGEDAGAPMKGLDALRNAPAAGKGLASVGSSASAAIAFRGIQGRDRMPPARRAQQRLVTPAAMPLVLSNLCDRFPRPKNRRQDRRRYEEALRLRRAGRPMGSCAPLRDGYRGSGRFVKLRASRGVSTRHAGVRGPRWGIAPMARGPR